MGIDLRLDPLRSLLISAILPLSLLLAHRAQAELITFDNIPVAAGTSIALANRYAGLIWSGVSVENHFSPSYGFASYGFETGIVSQTNAADGINVSFKIVSGTFTFNSGYFTKVYGGDRFGIGIPNAETITVRDNLGQSKSFTINRYGPTFETFNWSGVATVSISETGPSSGLTNFVFDNLTVSKMSALVVPREMLLATGVPELTTWSMMLLGFIGAGYAGCGVRRSLLRSDFSALALGLFQRLKQDRLRP